jgi:hypothetical protein
MGVISNGTTLLDAGAIDSGIPTGAMTLIKTLTASSSGTLSFINGASSVVLDGTYDSYVFKYYDIHPATDNADFEFNMTIDGTNWNVTKTTTTFYSYHTEDNSGTPGVTYETGYDLAQGTGFQYLAADIGNGNDESASGELSIYSPSSTTFVKHFLHSGNRYVGSNISANDFVSGYGNTTSAVTGIQFKMSSGNIDSGVIKMYGIK